MSQLQVNSCDILSLSWQNQSLCGVLRVGGAFLLLLAACDVTCLECSGSPFSCTRCSSSAPYLLMEEQHCVTSAPSHRYCNASEMCFTEAVAPLSLICDGNGLFVFDCFLVLIGCLLRVFICSPVLFVVCLLCCLLDAQSINQEFKHCLVLLMIKSLAH